MSTELTHPRPFKDHKKWAGTLLLMPLILLLDQPTASGPNWTGQIVGSCIGWLYWALFYRQVSKRLRKMMVIGLTVGLAGELLLAFGLDMYSYRFGNIPFYVPPGHVSAMAVTFLFIRENWVRQHRRLLEDVLLLASFVYAVTWLFLYNDIYGFILYIAFFITILFSTTSRLFFLVIFAVTVYMELIGTYLGCWAWHPILMNRFESLPGANPPGGISFLYLFFDITCLGIFFLADLPLRSRYDRMKAYKKARAKERRLRTFSPT